EPEHVAAPCLPPGDPVEPPQLLERIDPDVRVGADAERDAALPHPPDRCETVAQVRLGRRADADARSRLGDQVELRVRGVRRMDDGGTWPEAAGVREQLDRPAAVLREALLDLARL